MSSVTDRFTPVRPLGPYLLLVQDLDGMPLVLKRLADDALADPAARHAFRLEAWRVGQLRGQRLVRRYADASGLDERPFYTMGYAEGPPATLVQPGDVKNVVRHLLEALAELHSRGWVHAALAPAHLRRTEAGLVLVGYGNLTPVGTAARRPGLTGYRSPEQARGRPLDARADLYSVGALIHFWLTNEVPGELDLLDLVADPLAALGRRLLSLEPADRLPDAQAALAALAGEPLAPARSAPPPVLVTPTLPRPEAMAPFQRLLDDLGDGRGGARRLEAPAGAGKTTLLAAGEALARAAGWPVVRLSGQGTAAWPLTPWREALPAFVAMAQERQPGLADRYRLRLAPMGLPATVAALTDAGRAGEGEGALGGELSRRRLATALGELLAAAAAPGLVVLLDDWELADEASRALLGAMVARLADEPVLWIVATPPGEPELAGPVASAMGIGFGAAEFARAGAAALGAAAAGTDGGGQSNALSARFAGATAWPALPVPPFSNREVATLANHMLPAPARPTDLATLAAASAGQPWWVKTAIATWRDAAELTCRPDACDLPAADLWPDTPGALAWRRGSTLDAAAWAVGGAAALLAPRIRAAELMALMPEADVLAEGLDGLLRAGILAPGPGGYVFTHPEYTALYAQVLPREQQVALHRALLDAALAPGGPPLDPLAAALHAVRAEWPEAAAPLALGAARRVLALGGLLTAKALLEEGVVMLDAEHPLRGAFMGTLGEAHRQAGETLAALACLQEARGRVQPGPDRPAAALALARVLTQLGRTEEACQAWREAAGHAQGLGDMDLFALALAGLTEAQLALGQVDEALSSGEAAAGAAAEAAPQPRALALAALGAVLAVGPRERQAEGVALLQQASALFEAEGDRPRLARTLLALGEAELARGELLFARSTAERALTLASDLDDGPAMLAAGLQAAAVALGLGDALGSAARAADARRLAEARQDIQGAAEAQAAEGLARTLAGDAEAGLALGGEAIRRLPASAPPVAAARVWLAHAEAALARALYPEAAHALHLAGSFVKDAARPDLAGKRSYLLGLWAARTGDRERARQELRAVLAQPNQHVVALAALRLGQLAVEAGARAEAAGWLEQARRTALQLGAESLASEAERAEKALVTGNAAEDDSPGWAADRLEALFAEARSLLPRVVAPAEDLAALRAKLTQAQTLNQLWPRLFVARNATEAADALATACFEALPGAARVFVLDPALQPWTSRARSAGELAFTPELIDAGLCEAALERRAIRVEGGRMLAMALAEDASAPVWGVAYVVGDGLAKSATLARIAAAGALALARF